ncbi:MAG TPA: MATE family efflux transporter [Lachnospiraceae bacterium]|nr:MATE family efflux transporter [Lachnospiraceae bacterium]
MQNDEKEQKMNSNLKEFIRYTTLNVLGMIGLSGYILADTFFIAKGLGANGLTALNLAIPIYSFIHGTGLMLGMGGATKYAIFWGQKEHQKSHQVFTNTLYLTVLSAAVFMFTGSLLSGKITALLGADGAVFSMTETYLRIILLFAPAFLLNEVLICFVRNDNNPKLSMLAMLTGSLSNILLDYIFIFPLHLGIRGAVLATGAAPVISICILSWHFIRRQNNFHWIKTKISASLAGNILSLGLSSLINEAASGIVMIAFNMLILSLQGNTGVAAYGVIANLSLVVISIYTGIAQGTQPIISRTYGSGDKNSQRQILKYAIITTEFLSVCIYLLFFQMAYPIVSIFNSEKNMQLQQIAVTGLKLYFTAIPFAGFNIILAMYFAATDHALPAQVISLARGLFLILPAAVCLSWLIGMSGIWLSFPITEIIVTIAGIFLYHRN